VGRMGSAKLALAATVLCAGALHSVGGARADAALAVGLPSDVAKQGLAMGWAFNYASKETAQAEALKRCRGFRDAPQSTRDLCKIVESFRDSCMAVALDPDYGTTGLGWGVHNNQEWAEDAAMEKCMETSDQKRRSFCRVTVTRCDRR
jgi:hypothetical protein